MEGIDRAKDQGKYTKTGGGNGIKNNEEQLKIINGKGKNT